MKRLAVILCFLAAGCAQPPATFKTVDYPAQPEADWVKSEPSGAVPDHSRPSAEEVTAFAEDPATVASLRVAASAEDFYGSKLYDGLDVTVQPLDASGTPVKKLGRMTATLYRFEGYTLEGKGERLLTWSVGASRMRTLWVERGIDRCCHMRLAWDRRPMVADVKLEVRFETLDGRAFTRIIAAGSVDQPRYRWLEK